MQLGGVCLIQWLTCLRTLPFPHQAHFTNTISLIFARPDGTSRNIWLKPGPVSVSPSETWNLVYVHAGNLNCDKFEWELDNSHAEPHWWTNRVNPPAERTENQSKSRKQQRYERDRDIAPPRAFLFLISDPSHGQQHFCSQVPWESSPNHVFRTLSFWVSASLCSYLLYAHREP